LFAGIDDDRGFEALLRILNFARVISGLRFCEPFLKLLVAGGRHVIGVLPLRPRRDDLTVAVVLFYKCATHGGLGYTRFWPKDDRRAVDAVFANGLQRRRAVLQ